MLALFAFTASLWLMYTRQFGLLVAIVLVILGCTVSLDSDLSHSSIPLDFGFVTTSIYIDDLALWFVILLAICCLWIVTSMILKSNVSFLVYILVLYVFACSLLFFVSGELLMIYFAFELVTIPILLYVGMLGVSSRRVYALSVMILYMLFSSGLMAVLLFGYIEEFMDASHLMLGLSSATNSSDSWLLTVIVIVFFGVKIPVFPFYIWLPEAHVESNTEMSVLLASIMLKFGVFGLLRIGYWIDSSLIQISSTIMIGICIVGLVHSTISSIHHLDMKKLIAYSSIVHMQFGLLGLLMNDTLGLWLAVVGLLIHGFVSIGLFYCMGIASESVGSRHILFIHAGILMTPILSVLGFATILLNISAPLSIAAIVEFAMLLVYGEFGYTILWIGVLCAILGCSIFSLILLYRAYMSDTGWYNSSTQDISILDSILMLAMYGILIFGIVII